MLCRAGPHERDKTKMNGHMADPQRGAERETHGWGIMEIDMGLQQRGAGSGGVVGVDDTMELELGIGITFCGGTAN